MGIFVKSITLNKNTSVTLGPYFDDFTQNLIRQGRYKNLSEIIRAGLRLLEQEEKKTIALRYAIDEGLNSPIAEDFDPELHLKELKARKKDG